MPHEQPVPPPDPNRPGADVPLSGWADLEEVAGGDVVAGDPPVPITVWRPVATGDADPAGDAPPTACLSAWLARRLVATYSRPGRAVVDFDNDPPLRHAATAGGRSYLPLSRSGDLADLDTTTPVDLISLRWPRPAATATTGAVADLFRACRLVLGPQGHTAVIIQPPANLPYAEHTHELVPAAQTAGMGYLQHIIAVLSPIVGDQLLPPDGGAPSGGDPALHTRVHLDMLIFVVKASRRHG